MPSRSASPGFTLIELLVVLAVIAIMAAFATTLTAKSTIVPIPEPPAEASAHRARPPATAGSASTPKATAPETISTALARRRSR